MYTDLIKYFIIFLINFYISFKLLKQKTKSFHVQLLFIIYSFALAVLSTTLNLYYPWSAHLISVLTLWVFQSLYTSRPQISFIVVTFSLGISYCLHAFSSFISTSIIYSIIQRREHFPVLAMSLFGSILHCCITFALFKIKRFQKGLPLLQSNNYTHLATLLGIFFIALPTNPLSYRNPLWQQLLFLFISVCILAFFIYWWQAQITKSYRRNLELRELESLRTEIVQKDSMIQKLMEDNENLARITHRDNSLISALKDATIKHLSTDYKNTEEAVAAKEKLLSNIATLSAGRNSLSHNFNTKETREFDTGLSLLDDLLSHMDKQAMKQGILFSVNFNALLGTYVPTNISESDLVHTIDDLLKNAFKSTQDVKSPMVQLQFYKLGKHLVVEVSDNGIPFEIYSLVNMGIKKLTTYEDGSGIGLMDIWKTKEKYRATYHLDEYDIPSPFAKKISLTFDKKNLYTIRSFRKNAILGMSRRADLQVYEIDTVFFSKS